jgi:hypothetical protein
LRAVSIPMLSSLSLWERGWGVGFMARAVVSYALFPRPSPKREKGEKKIRTTTLTDSEIPLGSAAPDDKS